MRVVRWLRGLILGNRGGVFNARLGLRGSLGIKVIRANPTRRQRIGDAIARLLGRYE